MSTIGQGQMILGNYRVGISIGEGTFGKVKLGTHILTQQKVAIKTLQKQKIIQQSDIQRVTREICILKILRHPNIIQLYQIIETKTDIHLIMQYAQGGQLFDYIVKRKRLDQTQAIRFMQQIISGVQYIHKNGIVHRDLKPQNLLLDHNRNIKIVDFGLSNQYKPGEKLKTACGSPCYAAPEMIAGKKYQCLNADIWSCGIILYAMLCGYLPFQDPNTNKLYRKIIAGDFEMPKILSADAKDILRNILNVNPQTRFKISQIRSSRWFNLTNYKYESKGIIVGKDQIQPNDQIVRRMQQYNFDPVQARTYIINNRHNHTTALYYLLEIKLSRSGKLQTENSTITQNSANKLMVETPQHIQQSVKTQNSTIQVVNRERTHPVQKIDDKKREESPVIYRPQKKADYYVPYIKKPKQVSKQHSNKNNDSMNVSNIISSLVQANKIKHVNRNAPTTTGIQKKDHFDKLQQFKLFPNKKNSSIYQPSSASKLSTSRSKNEDKQFQFQNRQSLNGIENRKASITTQVGFGSTISQYNKEQSKGSISVENRHQTIREDDTSNRKRKELSDQLKQISIKIDQQIMELKKQNGQSSTVYNPNRSRDSINGLSGHSQIYINNSAVNRKKSDATWLNPNTPNSTSGSKQQFAMSNKESLSSSIMNQSVRDASIRQPTINQSLNFSNQRQSFQSSTLRSDQQIKTHTGPFNTQCIFMQNARVLISKIGEYLGRNSIKYQENQVYSLLMTDGDRIYVEAIQGITGVHLVKFTSNHNIALNQNVLQYLAK